MCYSTRRNAHLETVSYALWMSSAATYAGTFCALQNSIAGTIEAIAVTVDLPGQKPCCWGEYKRTTN